MSKYYMLIDDSVIETDDLIKWAKWFEQPTVRVIQQTRLAGPSGNEILVSTVFLGLDHNFSFSGPPVLFETMIFGAGPDEYQERYETIGEAREGHMRACATICGTETPA